MNISKHKLGPVVRARLQSNDGQVPVRISIAAGATGSEVAAWGRFLYNNGLKEKDGVAVPKK